MWEIANLCSGQTGSGKTYTMQGPQFLDGQSLAEQEDRGLILRTFEYLFGRIAQEQSANVIDCSMGSSLMSS